MIARSRDCALSRWRAFFFACRTAIRTQAGLQVAEFIFPLLVLDRICFGDSEDKAVIREEIADVLRFESQITLCMALMERQKVANVLFMVFDTLAFWIEHEVEERQRSSRSSGTSSSKGRRRGSDVGFDDKSSEISWPSDETILKIEDFLKTISLQSQANAATNVGMHARALRLLEMAARQVVVDKIFKAPCEAIQIAEVEKENDFLSGIEAPNLKGIDLNLFKNVLASLDDSETIAAIGDEANFSEPSAHVMDSIRQNEAAGKWDAALQDYERALQLEAVKNGNSEMERGALKCLLELGQFESVLNQARGLANLRSQKIGENLDFSNALHVAPLAVEAAWRLGRWDVLSTLLENSNVGLASEKIFDSGNMYQLEIGAAMLGLKNQDVCKVAAALEDARRAIMHDLSNAARESYARCYPHIVRLHCLREVENATEVLCKDKTVDSLSMTEVAELNTQEGWSWNARLDLISPQGAGAVISTRLALSRLANEPSLEGALFLCAGKKARKNGFHSIAANFFSQAEAAFTCIPTNDIDRAHKIGNFLDPIRLQMAKLKRASGDSTTALKILGQDSVQKVFEQMMPEFDNENALRTRAVRYERQRLGGSLEVDFGSIDDEKNLVDRFAKRMLKLTQWTIEGGLKGGAEIMHRFRIIHKLSPNWEKGIVACNSISFPTCLLDSLTAIFLQVISSSESMLIPSYSLGLLPSPIGHRTSSFVSTRTRLEQALCAAIKLVTSMY